MKTLLLFTLSGVLYAETPIVATVTHTMYSPSGQILNQVHGTYARSSSGNEATHMAGAPGHITLGGKVYEVNPASNSYHGVNLPTASSGPLANFAPPPGAATRVINGLNCVAVPVRDQATQRTIGTVWRSIDYGVEVHSEFDVYNPNGTLIGHMVRDMSNIQTGIEPDARVFQLPQKAN